MGGCSVVCRNCRRDVEIMQGMDYIIIYALLILLMSFFFIVLPNKKRHKRVQEMHKSIRAGDTVITIGGVIATVIELEEDTLTIRRYRLFRLRIPYRYRRYAPIRCARQNGRSPAGRALN